MLHESLNLLMHLSIRAAPWARHPAGCGAQAHGRDARGLCLEGRAGKQNVSTKVRGIQHVVLGNTQTQAVCWEEPGCEGDAGKPSRCRRSPAAGRGPAMSPRGDGSARPSGVSRAQGPSEAWEAVAGRAAGTGLKRPSCLHAPEPPRQGPGLAVKTVRVC